MTADEVLLITRARTNNKGNQALSAAWVAMLQNAFPGAPVRVLERRPRHLVQFTLAQFARAKDPFRELDRVTTELARLAPGAAAIGPVRETARIVLDENIVIAPRFAALRQRLNLRRWAARAGRYRAEYRTRLAAMQRARLVVLNPAGEFFPDDPMPALYHLLDLFVAHKLGRPTAIVNHTMDVVDPTLRRLIPPIYRQLDLVGFRDAKSVEAFRAMGGDTANVVVTPDLALATASPAPRPHAPNKIAVAIHTPAAAWTDRTAPWIDVITKLRAQGFDVDFVSNEVPSDQAFYEQVRARVPIALSGAGLDYDRYSEMLGGFDFVVSSRMHTSILAMVAGTPVIPVEGPSFKITGLFQELGLATRVIQPGSADFSAQVVASALAMRGKRDAASAEAIAKVKAARERMTNELVPRLRQAVEHA